MPKYNYRISCHFEQLARNPLCVAVYNPPSGGFLGKKRLEMTCLSSYT